MRRSALALMGPVISRVPAAALKPAPRLGECRGQDPSVDENRRRRSCRGYILQPLRQRRKQQRAVGAGPTENETRLDVGRFREGVFSALRAASTCGHGAPRVWLSLRVEHEPATTLFCASRCSRTATGRRARASSNARATRRHPRAFSARRKARSRERQARATIQQPRRPGQGQQRR